MEYLKMLEDKLNKKWRKMWDWHELNTIKVISGERERFPFLPSQLCLKRYVININRGQGLS